MNSFLQGKKTLTVPPLRASLSLRPTIASTTPPSSPLAAAHSHSDSSHPTVEVVKEGDKVVRLVVICTCGERVEIECLYPGGA